tara:strand:- start:1956 stop:2186 length:231 start_codon:yes stop_codon:yes gene_type:complete
MSFRFNVSRPVENALAEWPGKPVKNLMQTNLNKFVLAKREQQADEHRNVANLVNENRDTDKGSRPLSLCETDGAGE